MSSDQVLQQFTQFYGAARRNEALDDETRVLLHLAASMAVGCYPCMEHYLGEAERIGLCQQKIDAAKAIVMAVSAGRVNAQLREVAAQMGGPAAAGNSCCSGDAPTATDSAQACCEPGSGCC